MNRTERSASRRPAWGAPSSRVCATNEQQGEFTLQHPRNLNNPPFTPLPLAWRTISLAVAFRLFSCSRPPPSTAFGGASSCEPASHHTRSKLDLRLGGNSTAFVRLINALARATRETLLVQKYREACSRGRAALQELKNPKRELTEEERRAIILKVDNILGVR